MHTNLIRDKQVGGYFTVLFPKKNRSANMREECSKKVVDTKMNTVCQDMKTFIIIQ